MTRRGALAGAVVLGVLLTAGCGNSDPVKPEASACRAWLDALNSPGGASTAKLHSIADESQGEVHNTMEAYITLSQMDATGPSAKNAFSAVKDQCARLGIS